MNDSHYYIDNLPLNGWAYLSGGLFHPVPGTYELPLHQGRYVLYGARHDDQFKLHVTMNTRGTTQFY